MGEVGAASGWTTPPTPYTGPSAWASDLRGPAGPGKDRPTLGTSGSAATVCKSCLWCWVLPVKADRTKEHVLGTWSPESCMVPLPVASHLLWDGSSGHPVLHLLHGDLGFPNLYLLVSQQLLLPLPAVGAWEWGWGGSGSEEACPGGPPGEAQCIWHLASL